MRAAIFDCYDDYEIRVKFVKKYLEKTGYETEIFFSDFDHMKKHKTEKKRDGVNYIAVMPYKRNLSAERLLSHFLFAKKCRKIAENENFDLIYCIVPPNSLVNEFGKFKEKNSGTKLIFDVCDLWPETFPSGKAKKLLALPFAVWRSFRKKRLDKADSVVAECELFAEKLQCEVSGKEKTDVLYLCKEKPQKGFEPERRETIGRNILYLGSINNIIDCDVIVKFMEEMKKLCNSALYIIGDGENRENLLRKLDNAGIETHYFGVVYDEEKKLQIKNKCAFGLNIMKKDVCVGLTMKSIDYFSAGLPVINNIKGDTTHLVEDLGTGFNICNDDDNSIKECAEKAAQITDEELLKMKEDTLKMFDTLFSNEAFEKKLAGIIEKIK